MTEPLALNSVEFAEKISKLSAKELLAVSLFIDDLTKKDLWRHASDAILTKIWDNEEDAVYDTY